MSSPTYFFSLLFLLFPAFASAQEDFYTGCGVTKGCYGNTDACVQDKNCDVALSYSAAAIDLYNLEIIGRIMDDKADPYFAAALSEDAGMGNDNAMACLGGGYNRVEMYWNFVSGDQKGTQKLGNPSLGLSNQDVQVVDGFVRCKFVREAFINITNRGVFDLNAKRYFVLFARGNVDAGSGDITVHGDTGKFPGRTELFFGWFNSFKPELKAYAGCEEEKGCRGWPGGCLQDFSCNMLVTYKGVSKTQYEFELLGLEEDFVALALSVDTRPGSDSVVACKESAAERYWLTDAAPFTFLLEDPQQGLTNVNVSREGNYLYCSFIHDAVLTFTPPVVPNDGPVTFDLNNNKYNLLLGRGPLLESGEIADTTESGNATSEAISLADFNKFLDPDYDGCYVTKGCFGYPDNCVDSNSCEILSTYREAEDGNFIFSISGSIGNRDYLGLALSDDPTMGDDSAMICYTTTSAVRLMMTWNNAVKDDGSTKLDDPLFGIVEGETVLTNEDGKVRCTFKREAITDIPVPGSNSVTKSFNLKDNGYHLLLAKGNVDLNNNVMVHSAKHFSANKVDLGSLGEVKGGSITLVKLHGCFMIIAWYMMGNIGIFTARYCKKNFNGKKLFGKDLWFPIHQGCMIMTWLLTCTAFFILLAKYKVDPLKWSAVQNNPHSVLGLVSFSLMFIQPFMAMIRCDPGDKRRPIFNWAHFVVGVMAKILANVAIFYTTKESFTKINLGSGAQGIVIAHLAFISSWHVMLSVYNLFIKKKKEKDDGKADHVITFGMVTYFVGTFGLAVAMVVMIAMGDAK